jgi:hypothetical protein
VQSWTSAWSERTPEQAMNLTLHDIWPSPDFGTRNRKTCYQSARIRTKTPYHRSRAAWMLGRFMNVEGKVAKNRPKQVSISCHLGSLNGIAQSYFQFTISRVNDCFHEGKLLEQGRLFTEMVSTGLFRTPTSSSTAKQRHGQNLVPCPLHKEETWLCTWIRDISCREKCRQFPELRTTTACSGCTFMGVPVGKTNCTARVKVDDFCHSETDSSTKCCNRVIDEMTFGGIDLNKTWGKSQSWMWRVNISSI